jgi:hypothetical protein
LLDHDPAGPKQKTPVNCQKLLSKKACAAVRVLMKKIMRTSTAILLGTTVRDPDRFRRHLDSRELLQDSKKTAEKQARAREQEVTMWILLIVLLVLSLFSAYLLWAKVAYSWPFQF